MLVNLLLEDSYINNLIVPHDTFQYPAIDLLQTTFKILVKSERNKNGDDQPLEHKKANCGYYFIFVVFVILLGQGQ